MFDQVQMAGGDVDALTLCEGVFGDGFGQSHADAEALKIGKRHKARDAAVVFAAHELERGAEGGWEQRMGRGECGLGNESIMASVCCWAFPIPQSTFPISIAPERHVALR